MMKMHTQYAERNKYKSIHSMQEQVNTNQLIRFTELPTQQYLIFYLAT